MLDVLNTVNNWMSDEQPIIIATVTQTWGSAPRSEGSVLAFREDLSMIGSVSGGCIENAVIEEGLLALDEHTGRWLKYGVSDDTAWEVGLSCGGRINVYVEELDRQWWQTLSQCIDNNQSVTTIRVLDGALQDARVIFDANTNVIFKTDNVSEAIIAEWEGIAVKAQTPSEITWNDMPLFVDVFTGQPHLIIIGGVHIAMPLQTIAGALGFRVSLIDPRTAFASDERFPEIETILHSYPDKALPQLGLNKFTYVAVLTHDPKIDDKALTTALPSDAPYIGVLSSRKTHQKRTNRLLEAGIPQQQIDRIYTPIGLGIGAKNPEEIALAIMAEIVAVRNGTHPRQNHA